VVIGICTIEIVIPGARSLKDKRRTLRSILDRLRHRHNVSVSEVEHQDLWQRAGLAIAAVSSSQKSIDAMFESILEEIEAALPGYITHRQVEFI
jgi:hypothetical protein